MAASAGLMTGASTMPRIPASTCCGATLTPADAQRTVRGEPLAVLAAAFALSILAHSLTLGALPLAGSLLAPIPALAYLPFVALLAGALCGARLGAMLVPRHGWRVHALAASLCGALAATVAATAVLVQSYALLVAGASLLGLAQAMGFGLRHGSAVLADAAGAPLRGGLVLAAGALAALAGPTLSVRAEAATAPYLMLGTFLLVALVHLAALPLASALAPRVPEIRVPEADVRRMPVATAATHPARVARAARLTWFAMAAGMAHAPLAMVGCGIAPGGIGSVIAWHVLAMYAPAAPAGLLVHRLGTGPVAIAGGALALTGLVLLALSGTAGSFLAAMVLLGIGWSLATVAAQAAASGGASVLMRQETGLFAAALAGALSGIALA